MSLILLIAVFAFGAIIASFVGVIVARFNTGKSFLSGRSHCDACYKNISSFSLVPIVSYIAQKGRARCCDTRLSFGAPFTELLLGVLFLLTFARVGFVSALPFILLSLSALLALVLYDIKHQILPFEFLAVFIASSALARFLLESSVGDFVSVVVVAFSIAASLALIHFLSRGRAMGFADAPFSFGLALLVGNSALSGFIFSFWIGGVVGIVLLARRPRGSRMGVEVPFAPFLAAGFLLAYFTQWNPFTLISFIIGG